MTHNTDRQTVLTNRSQMAADRRKRPHFVYQIWSGDTCLYVGATANVGQRLSAHSKKEWWHSATRVIADVYPNKYDALDVERDLIQELDPWHNQQCVL